MERGLYFSFVDMHSDALFNTQACEIMSDGLKIQLIISVEHPVPKITTPELKFEKKSFCESHKK